jgi:hypothetical protein
LHPCGDKALGLDRESAVSVLCMPVLYQINFQTPGNAITEASKTNNPDVRKEQTLCTKNHSIALTFLLIKTSRKITIATSIEFTENHDMWSINNA